MMLLDATSATSVYLLIPIMLALVNGKWVNDTLINPSPGTDPMNAMMCTVIINAPWLGTMLYYAIYASVLIFVAATEGKFIKFCYVSFGMIFLAVPFVHYGCVPPVVASAIPFMNPSNLSVPIAGFILTLIAAILLG